jgi:rubrerythrin
MTHTLTTEAGAVTILPTTTFNAIVETLAAIRLAVYPFEDDDDLDAAKAKVDQLMPQLDEDELRHAVATLDWDGPTDSDGLPCFYLNKYECTDCGIEWEDQWSCGCDDECPSCGRDLSPVESIDVTAAS